MKKVIILKSGFDIYGPVFEFNNDETSAIINFLKDDNIITLIGNTSLYNRLCDMCPSNYEKTNILLIPFPPTYGVPLTTHHNYNLGVDENNFDSIIHCIQKVYPWLKEAAYSYLEISNRYPITYNDIYIPKQTFAENEIEIEKCKMELIELLRSNKFEKIPQKNAPTIKKDLSINNLLVSDKIGTIIGESFFQTEAPFEKNMEQIIEFLRIKENHLCTITSGSHQEGFIANEIYDKIVSFETLENLICFDQYNMATTLKGGYRKCANNVWLGYGETNKAEILRNYLAYLEQNGQTPRNLYGIGDSPIDDLPMLKEIYLRNGQVAFISPYHTLDEMIMAVKRILLNTSNSVKKTKNEYEKLYEINTEKAILNSYHIAVQNICDNWEWLKSNIYEEAYVFVKKIND